MLRILILLLVLLVVALTTWQDRYRSTRWREPLYVAIYPIAADESAGHLALCRGSRRRSLQADRSIFHA